MSSSFVYILLQYTVSYDIHAFTYAHKHIQKRFLFPTSFAFSLVVPYMRALMPVVGRRAICTRAGVMVNKLRKRI